MAGRKGEGGRGREREGEGGRGREREEEGGREGGREEGRGREGGGGRVEVGEKAKRGREEVCEERRGEGWSEGG